MCLLPVYYTVINRPQILLKEELVDVLPSLFAKFKIFFDVPTTMSNTILAIDKIYFSPLKDYKTSKCVNVNL